MDASYSHAYPSSHRRSTSKISIPRRKSSVFSRESLQSEPFVLLLASNLLAAYATVAVDAWALKRAVSPVVLLAGGLSVGAVWGGVRGRGRFDLVGNMVSPIGPTSARPPIASATSELIRSPVPLFCAVANVATVCWPACVPIYCVLFCALRSESLEVSSSSFRPRSVRPHRRPSSFAAQSSRWSSPSPVRAFWQGDPLHCVHLRMEGGRTLSHILRASLSVVITSPHSHRAHLLAWPLSLCRSLALSPSPQGQSCLSSPRTRLPVSPNLLDRSLYPHKRESILLTSRASSISRARPFSRVRSTPPRPRGYLRLSPPRQPQGLAREEARLKVRRLGPAARHCAHARDGPRRCRALVVCRDRHDHGELRTQSPFPARKHA